MKSIDSKIHGILDYITVLIFALAPLILSFSGFAAILSYILAVVHLGMTLLTDFELGYLDIVKTQYHKFVELAVGPVLIIIAFIFAIDNLSSPAVFYTTMGVIILLVGIFSDYSESKPLEEGKHVENKKKKVDKDHETESSEEESQ